MTAIQLCSSSSSAGSTTGEALRVGGGQAPACGQRTLDGGWKVVAPQLLQVQEGEVRMLRLKFYVNSR